jgi:hypothetical protein
VAVLTGATFSAICRPARDFVIIGRMMTEAPTHLASSGHSQRRNASPSRWLHVSAMLQDLTHGRPLEIDVLACSIAEMRSLVGFTTRPSIWFSTSRARHPKRLIRTPTPPLPTDGLTLGIAVQQSSGVS